MLHCILTKLYFFFFFSFFKNETTREKPQRTGEELSFYQRALGTCQTLVHVSGIKCVLAEYVRAPAKKKNLSPLNLFNILFYSMLE